MADAVEFMKTLDWPGNVRQLENVCRWLTVMASGNEIQKLDLPEDLQNSTQSELPSNWQDLFRQWVKQQFVNGELNLLQNCEPDFERILIEEAMIASKGHKQNAAKILGWGRNTLTRKQKELGLED